MKFWIRYSIAVLMTSPLWAGTLVQFRTALGDLEFELYDQEKPITSANFLRYVRENAYDGCIFHRVEPRFVIQGGGFKMLNRNGANPKLAYIETHPAITNEYGVGPSLGNTLGTLAMAKTSDPNSATSQFFINLKDNRSSLNNPLNSGGFTVFARLASGTNTLKLLDSFVLTRDSNQPLTNVVVSLDDNILPSVPILMLATNQLGEFEVRPQDFLYVDVTTLGVAVTNLPSGTRQISWNGLPNGTNTVQFTTVFPPNWQTLTNLVRPTDARPSVEDPSGDTKRFYRVKVDYPPTGL